MTLSTHVLDTRSGLPAVGLGLQLLDAAGRVLATCTTDQGGRAADLTGGSGGGSPAPLGPGTYRLVFATGDYLGPDAFYPEVTVSFIVVDGRHLHVPLLLGPFAYSTYRGS